MNEVRNIKDEKETHQLKLFANASSLFSIGEIEKANPPEPDFNVSIDGKLIGIELMELHYSEDEVGFNRKQYISESERIVKLAQTKFEKIFQGTALDVHISFTDKSGTINNNAEFILKRNDKERLSNIIVDLIKNNIPAKGEQVCIEELYFEKWGEWEKKLESVWVDNVTGKYKSTWSALFAGCVGYLNKEIIQQALKKKEDKPKNYENNYSKIWLLMTCNKGSYSTYFCWENVEVLKNEKFDTPYDRLFVFDLFDNSIVELKKVENGN